MIPDDILRNRWKKHFTHPWALYFFDTFLYSPKFLLDCFSYLIEIMKRAVYLKERTDLK